MPSTQFSDYELQFLIVVFLSSFPIARPFVERALGALIPLATHWAGKMLSRTPKYQRRELVEEAVQNWQIELLDCASRVNPNRSVAAYAFGILLHCCYTEIRRAKRTSNLPLTSDVFDETPGVEEGIFGSETRCMIEVALGDLPSHYRQILIEQYWEGLSAAESAERHDATVRAIESLRFRAHAAMAIALLRRGYLR